MSIIQEFKEKVSKLIFLEFKRESIINIFKIEASENIYFPIRSERVINKVKEGEKLENIPLSYFVEGMFYVLGGDEAFKYNNIYTDILNINKNEFVSYIKEIIYSEIKKESYEDAYILLKGLINIEENEDNFNKILIVSEAIRKKKPEFKEEEIEILARAKNIEDYAKPYLYEAYIQNEDKDFTGALFSINKYIEHKGELNSEVMAFKHSLENVNSYEKAKEIMYERPKDSLKMFMKLVDEFEDDAILLYYIGVNYRILENHEKAIYYLNEALTLDSAIVEVFNELGINYAALSDFDKAILYLRKAFEVTKSIEICTNLVMCYLNKGDTKQAKLHYEIAEKMNPNDDVVVSLRDIMKNF